VNDYNSNSPLYTFISFSFFINHHGIQLQIDVFLHSILIFQDINNVTDIPYTSWRCANSSTTARGNSSNCSNVLTGLLSGLNDEPAHHYPTPAQTFFTYFTPIIFFIGIIGNSVSLLVFLSKNMRKLSASRYLAALSTSDLLALLFYVLPEWIKHGLSSLPVEISVPFLQRNGTCQGMVYFQYIARFLSSWFVVFFTIERFIGVCFPLRRKDICDPKSASRVILATVVTACIGCVFKPILSETVVTITGYPVCTSTLDHQYLSFILDSIFGVVITFIPFVLITILNLLIIRRLVLRNKRHRKIRVVTAESIIRLEFTFILLAVSICFVSLYLPYFVVWCKRYWTIKQMFNLHSISPEKLLSHDNTIESLDESLHITRSVFYINYCINFFLYSVTGAYFRKELRHLFWNRGRHSYSYNYSRHCSAYFNRSNSNNASKTSNLRQGQNNGRHEHETSFVIKMTDANRKSRSS